jgi:hypothetical protein
VPTALRIFQKTTLRDFGSALRVLAFGGEREGGWEGMPELPVRTQTSTYPARTERQEAQPWPAIVQVPMPLRRYSHLAF